MARPERGTPEWDLWIAAIKVAINPPLKSRGATCQVHTSRIEELRQALDAVGIDWRTAKAKQEIR